MSNMVKKYSDIEQSVEKTLGEREEIMNRRGKIVTPRKYHMTEDQLTKGRKRWSERVSDVLDEIKSLSSTGFFNPYRENGGYYGGVQSLYLLGANKWHSYSDVRGMMQEDMSSRKSSTNRNNSWQKFAYRGAREGAASTKDLMGRIVQNFRTLQRLGGVHPYGWKLRQLNTTVDIRREADGIWYFKLNTDSVAPFYDITAFSSKKVPKGKKVEGKVITSSVSEVAV